jgi:hypothetical protein
LLLKTLHTERELNTVLKNPDGSCIEEASFVFQGEESDESAIEANTIADSAIADQPLKPTPLPILQLTDQPLKPTILTV